MEPSNLVGEMATEFCDVVFENHFEAVSKTTGRRCAVVELQNHSACQSKFISSKTKDNLEKHRNQGCS